MSADVLYLDSSALVKLVAYEPESAALRGLLRIRPRRASCAIARVELVRAVRPHGARAVGLGRRLLEEIDLISMDDALLDDAADLGGPELRSLDAIHLAAARALGQDLEKIVTYDRRMAAAAETLGLPVAAPGTPRERARR